MSLKLGELKSFVGGNSNSNKIGIPYSFAFSRAFDVRSDPAKMTMQPAALNQSGGVVKDLPMWFDKACSNVYAYGNTGYIYKNSSEAGTWKVDHIAPSSQGNGMAYFPQDGYLYYAQRTTIGRQSSPCTSGTYYDGFLESEGGAPTNTASILWVRASSMYAWIASQASLQITGDITMEAYRKMVSLPTTGQVFTLMSKWNQSGNQRSYKFQITTISNFFGDGRDGAKSITTNTTEAPDDANCTGTSGQFTLTITNISGAFASINAGDRVLIYQTRGTNVGNKQETTCVSYNAGTGVLTVRDALTWSPAHSATASDANKCQILIMRQYTTVSVSAGAKWTAKAWNGLKGGVLAFYANSSLTGANATTSVISADKCGYVGADISAVNGAGKQAEGTAGIGNTVSNPANGNAGGGGQTQGDNPAGGGGGGGHAVAGGNGGNRYGNGGIGGSAVGSTDQSTIFFGGAGGTGGSGSGYQSRGGGGSPEIGAATGGGILMPYCATVDLSNLALSVAGSQQNKHNSGGVDEGWRGDAASGAILIKCQNATMGTNQATAPSSIGWIDDLTTGGNNSGSGGSGGSASQGRITVYYSGAVTGTTNPTMTTIQDSSLNSTDGYALQLLISSNGTNSETYTQDITTLINTTDWIRWGVAWTSSTSTAVFYRNGAPLTTQTGAFTAIFASTAKFAINASFDGSGNPQDYADARGDDDRLWNRVRTASEMLTYCDRVLSGVDSNLSAYYQFENNVQDSQTYTTNANLAAVNSPTYSADVPFSGITTRADQDTTTNAFINASGSTYLLPTTISEASVDRQTFQPGREPIKSIMLNINTVGTGNWTLTVHDGLNRSIATLTVANALLHTGLYEFVFASSFRPILTANYHLHVTSTVNDGKIVSSSLNDMEGAVTPVGTTGAYLAIFYQILVDDAYHPMAQFLNFLAVGNERYVAELQAGNIYNPHQLTLPAGYRVRCFAFWGQYIAIGTWRGTSITDTDIGDVFFWNGTDSTFSDRIAIPEGSVNCMFGSQNQLFMIAGYEGKLISYAGGSLYTGMARTEKIDSIPLMAPGEYMEVAPGGMTMWRSILRIGAALNTNSTHLHEGLYGYGRLNTQYPYSMVYDHPLSLGDQQTSMVKTGGVFASGQNFYMGWQNGNTFGIDNINVANASYSSATLEMLITDLGQITKRKLPLNFRADFEPLIAGQSVTLKYKHNRESTWHIIGDSVQSTVGAPFTTGHIDDASNEIQLAIDVTNTAATTPSIIQLTLEAEGEEEAINAE